MSDVAKAWAEERAKMILPTRPSWDTATQHTERDWHESRVRERGKRGEAAKRAGGWHKNTKKK